MPLKKQPKDYLFGDKIIENNIGRKNSEFYGVCPCGVMVKAMDFRIVVCEFKLQLRFYVHFRANTLGKGMNPLILPAMG